MPLVEIDLLKGRAPDELDAICESVHQAMRDTLDVPEHDRFLVVREHTPDTLRFDRRYLRGDRSDAFVLVRLTLAAGRSTDAKRAFYARTAELLSLHPGIADEDVMIVLTENDREDWSFGRGQASYAEIPRDEWR